MFSSTSLSVVIIYLSLENVCAGKCQWNYLLYMVFKGDDRNPGPIGTDGHNLRISPLLQHRRQPFCKQLSLLSSRYTPHFSGSLKNRTPIL